MIGTGIGLGLSGFRVNPPGIPATLDLNFASMLSLTSSSGITPSFSRASTGTYFNSSSVLTTAAINGPRFDHVYNGSSWVSKGLLIEEQRTNLTPYSEQINDASWGFTTNITISANAATAPDGATTADLMYPTASSTVCETGKSVGSVNTSLIYTNSFFLKASGKTWARILSIRGDFGAWFNLSNGTVGTTLSGSTATIQNVGNGWYRCSVTRGTDFGTGYTFIRVTDGDNTSAITKNGTDGILVWGAQSEQGSFSTSYIPTTSASATRSADVMQITGSNFSGFYNASEGSVCFEGDSNGSTTASDTYFLICSDGSTFNNAAPFIFSSGSSNSLRHRLRAGGSDIFNITTSEQLARNTPIKLAQGYKTTDTVILANGSIIDSRTNSFSTSSISTFYIGQAFSGSAQINGHIARLRYWNTRLDNATLRALST